MRRSYNESTPECGQLSSLGNRVPSLGRRKPRPGRRPVPPWRTHSPLWAPVILLMSLCPSESLAVSCLPCATQRHPQGPGLGRGAPPPSDGLFVRRSPPIPSPPVSAPSCLRPHPTGVGTAGTGVTPHPRRENKGRNKDVTFSRPQKNGGGAILRPEVPRSECRLVASAPDPCPPPKCRQCRGPRHPHPEKQERPLPGEQPLPGERPLQPPSSPEGGPSVGGKQVHGNCSAELPALQLATWRHVVLKMPGSWKT